MKTKMLLSFFCASLFFSTTAFSQNKSSWDIFVSEAIDETLRFAARVAVNAAGDYIRNGINENQKNEDRQTINRLATRLEQIETEFAQKNRPTNYYEMKALMANLETLSQQNRAMQNKLSAYEQMLYQQNRIIVDTTGKATISGANFLKRFYSLAKAVGTNQTYTMLSANAQSKLGRGDYSNWWNKTVKSVHVNKVSPLGRNQYKVHLSYQLNGNQYQCSEE